MMWKLLIADDEPKIRRGLRSYVERSASGFEVVAEAADGDEALRLALEHGPDLLLVDVRMPFKSGLELIDELEGRLPGSLCVVVSGHDEFEYAQSAIKLKVFDYLLKPLSFEVFSQVLGRAAEELRAREASGKYSSWVREQLARNLPLLREGFLRDWSGGLLSRTELREGLAFLGLELEGRAALLGARFAERGEGRLSSAAQRLELVALRAVVEEAFAAAGSGSGVKALVFEDGSETVLALSPSAAEEELQGIGAAVRRRAAELSLRPPLLVVKPMADMVEGLAEACEELKASLAEGDNYDNIVIVARNYVETHLSDPDLSLESTAEALGLSAGYLSRLLKRETGAPFVGYLTRLRVKRAMELMNDPALRIFEVAERSGFRSQHYFSRTFRGATGYSPSDWRRGGGTES